MKITPKWLTAARRKCLYRVGMAVAMLLVAYGILTAEKALLWLTLVAGLLGIAQDNIDA